VGWHAVGHSQNPAKLDEAKPKPPAAKKKAPPQEASDFETRWHLFFYQPAAIANLTWSPDGTLLATVGSNIDRAGEITVWNARIAKVVYILNDVAGVRCVRFSPDGKQVVVGNPQGRIRVFQAETGKLLATMNEQGHGVLGMAYSPDGKFLATAGMDQAVILWDTASWKKAKSLRGHSGHVLDVAFLKEGGRLVTASADRTAKVWDVATAKAIATLPGHDSEVQRVAVSPDGRLVATQVLTRSNWRAGRRTRIFAGQSRFIGRVRRQPRADLGLRRRGSNGNCCRRG
jgi:WD40 repeat protein